MSGEGRSFEKNILLVENEEALRLLYREELEEEGYVSSGLSGKFHELGCRCLCTQVKRSEGVERENQRPLRKKRVP